MFHLLLCFTVDCSDTLRSNTDREDGVRAQQKIDRQHENDYYDHYESVPSQEQSQHSQEQSQHSLLRQSLNKPSTKVVGQDIGLSEARISRKDMLNICGNFNEKLKKASEQKPSSSGNAANILLATKSSQKSEESLLLSALRAVPKMTVPLSRGVQKSPQEQVKTIPSKIRKEKSPERIREKKSASFSKIIDESFAEEHPPSPSPSQAEPKTFRKVTKMYTVEEVDALLRRAKEEEKEKHFTTSTPEKQPSPIITKKTPRYQKPEVPTRISPRLSNLSTTDDVQNVSQLDRIQRVVSTKKKSLFQDKSGTASNTSNTTIPKGNRNCEQEGPSSTLARTEDSLLTIPPISPLATSLNQSVKDDIMLSNMNTFQREMMKESSKIIAVEHRKLTLELMKTQTMLVESTCQVSDAVKDTFQFSLQDITDAVTETLKKHAEGNSEISGNKTGGAKYLPLRRTTERYKETGGKS